MPQLLLLLLLLLRLPTHRPGSNKTQQAKHQSARNVVAVMMLRWVMPGTLMLSHGKTCSEGGAGKLGAMKVQGSWPGALFLLDAAAMKIARQHSRGLGSG